MRREYINRSTDLGMELDNKEGRRYVEGSIGRMGQVERSVEKFICFYIQAFLGGEHFGVGDNLELLSFGKAKYPL